MSDSSILSDYIDPKDLATETGRSERTILRWMDVTSPGLPHVKLGRKRLIHRAHFREWLDAREVRRNVPRR